MTADPSANWRALVAGRDTQRGTDQRDGDPTRDPWRGRADRFATYSAELPPDDPLFLRLRAAVRPDDTVLDVGAGAGRYALPLAGLAGKVVAVEPSPAMRRHLAALGIAADVQVGPASSGFRFADHAEAAAHYADRLRIPAAGERMERLHAALAAHLIQGRDGRWHWPGPLPRNAIVSWTPAREE